MKGLLAAMLVLPSTIAMAGGGRSVRGRPLLRSVPTMRKAGLAVALAGLVITRATGAMAGDLEVAVPAPRPPIAKSAPANPSSPSNPSDRRGKRASSSLGGSAYVLGGVVADSRGGVGSFGRAELDLYASIGLGDVSLLVGAPILLVEVAAIAGAPEVTTPLLLTVGARTDDWVITGAAGPVVGAVMSDRGGTIVSPRIEVRAGYRPDNSLEIEGMLGYEHRMVLDEPASERFMIGFSLGIGGDG